MDKSEKTRLNYLARLDIANAGKTTLWTLICLLFVNTGISIVQLIWYIWYDVQDHANNGGIGTPAGIAVSIVMMTLFVVHMLIMSGCFFACLNTYRLRMLEEESGMLKGIFKTFSIKIVSIISLLIYLACFILSIVSLLSPVLTPTSSTDTGTIMVVLIVINSLILSYISGIIFYYRLQVKKNIVGYKRKIEKTKNQHSKEYIEEVKAEQLEAKKEIEEKEEKAETKKLKHANTTKISNKTNKVSKTRKVKK